MDERRNLKSIRFIGIGMLILNVFYNLVFYLNSYGFHIKIFKGLTFESMIFIDIVPILFFVIVIISSKNDNIDEKTKEKIVEKSRFLYSFTIFFIADILISTFIFKISYMILDSIFMTIIYIQIIELTKKMMSLKSTDRKLEWQKACGYISEDSDESNFLWKLKIWCTPHLKIPFTKRWKSPKRLLYIAVLLYFFIGSKGTIFSLIIIVLLYPDVMSWIEAFLGLQTSLTGMCTGITEHNTEHSSSRYYKVYVTDFENKREISFYVNSEPFIEEKATMTVVHGMFSKRVLYVEGINLDIT